MSRIILISLMYMEIKDRLKLIIDAKNISKADMSRILEFNEGSISNYFSGKEYPGRKFLTLLIEKLDVNVNWLLTGKGEMFIGDKTD